MKILYVYSALARFAGTERIIVNKMNYLVNNNYDVYIVTTDQGNHKIPYDIDRKINNKDLSIRFHTIYSCLIYKRIFKYLSLKKIFADRLQEHIININPDIIVRITDMFVDTIIKFKLSIPIIPNIVNTYNKEIDAERKNKVIFVGRFEYQKGIEDLIYNYGPSNIITNNQDGFLIEPSDIKDFVSKIIYLIEHKKQRILMGKTAIENSKKYSAEQIMPIWTNLFNSLVNKNQTL